MMFERVKRTLGISDDQGLTAAGREYERQRENRENPQQDRDREKREQGTPDRLPEERQRLGGSERSKATLEQKRREMIEKQLAIEKRARENDNRRSLDAPLPANDDRSDQEILTARMGRDLGRRETLMATDRYNEINLRDEYWWHPAFNQSERAQERRSGPETLLDDDRDGRQVTHYGDGQSIAWDDPDLENSRGGFVKTEDWDMMMANDKERERQQDRDRDDRQQSRDRRDDDARRARDARETERDGDRERAQNRTQDPDRTMSDALDDRLPTFEGQQGRSDDDRVPNGVDPAGYERDDDISGSVTPDRDDLEERQQERDERDRDRQRGRGR